VEYEKLAEVIGLPVKEIRRFVAHMAEGYGDSGIQLLTYPNTCQLCTKEVFAPYIREALGIRRGGNLSNSSMEVLAVVAYNQPVTRSFVDTVRGVDSSYAVTSLLDKGLIEAVGRLDAPGRPMLYGTTDKFLRVFGLESLADLPETEALGVAAAQTEGVMVEEADKDQLSIDSAEEVISDAESPAADGEEATL
jgi:segregation and condensation protein B